MPSPVVPTQQRRRHRLLCVHFALVVSMFSSSFLVVRCEHTTGAAAGLLRDLPPHSTANNASADSLQALLVVPLHAASGTHHLTVYVGQPSQAQNLIVDTGSHLTAWTCSDCPDCGRTSYDPKKSSTQRKLKCGECELSTTFDKDGDRRCQSKDDKVCTMSQRYTEGSSWIAQEMSELVTLHPDGTQSPADEDVMDWLVSFTFGCQTTLTGLFRKQHANGILGLERTEHSLVHQMHQQGAIPRNAFSLCIGRASNFDNGSGSGSGSSSGDGDGGGGVMKRKSGFMSFGGALTSNHLEKMQFTPLVIQKLPPDSTTTTGRKELVKAEVKLPTSSSLSSSPSSSPSR